MDNQTNPSEIKRIKKLLEDKPRDLCLFTLGIKTAYKAGLPAPGMKFHLHSI